VVQHLAEPLENLIIRCPSQSIGFFVDMLAPGWTYRCPFLGRKIRFLDETDGRTDSEVVEPMGSSSQGQHEKDRQSRASLCGYEMVSCCYCCCTLAQGYRWWTSRILPFVFNRMQTGSTSCDVRPGPTLLQVIFFL
jgi:hypothetical protein